jgi:hydroxyethylthiazole kinase
MLIETFKNVRKKSPLVHCITNYVTVNDCANILLACGASPIMSDDVLEVEEITSICNALDINIGTLNQTTIPAMMLAGKKANQLKLPVILDPVGTGASTLRTKTAQDLLNAINFTVIRGNISEIKALAYGNGSTKGVDANLADAITDKNLADAIVFAKTFAKKNGAVTVITGAIDIVANDTTAYIIRNGHPMMSGITGSGCMLTALIGAYLGANTANPLEAAATAVISMGLSGELAYEKILTNGGGNATYRNYLIDEIYSLKEETLVKRMNYEIR